MGMTFVDAGVGNPGRLGSVRKVRFLVDTGAFLSVVPGAVLRGLGVRSFTVRSFRLADGRMIRRRVGVASFRFGRLVGQAEVVFGRPADESLLGVVTLESLGLEVDPRTRRLKRTKMYLMPILFGRN